MNRLWAVVLWRNAVILGSGPLSNSWKVGITRVSSVWSFFFFQAEDGIRDLTVTGVQTCALPICRGHAQAVVAAREPVEVHDRLDHDEAEGERGHREIEPLEPEARDAQAEAHEQIGRASCRERV